MVDELYRYQQKQYPVALVLAIIAGIFGAHRFYTGKSITGVLMLMSAGGGLVWWIVDLFRLRKIVASFNAEEAARAESGQPPQGLGFLPPRHELKLAGPPAWSEKNHNRAPVVGSAFVLAFVGFVMGTVSGGTGIYEPVVITLVMVAITLTAARWQAMSHLPVLGGLSRWNHRLRLYYHTIDPGSIWLLALRPIIGIFVAPWRRRAQAEVRLYLQLGAAFAVVFALFDLAEFSEAGSFSAGVGQMLGEFIQTMLYTYAFVAPTGAILITQLLLSRRDMVVWALSAVVVVFVYMGLATVGAI